MLHIAVTISGSGFNVIRTSDVSKNGMRLHTTIFLCKKSCSRSLKYSCQIRILKSGYIKLALLESSTDATPAVMLSSAVATGFEVQGQGPPPATGPPPAIADSEP